MESVTEYEYKIIFAGHGGVGKSIDEELDDVLEFYDVLSNLNLKQLTTLKEALQLGTRSQKRYLRKAYPETDRDGGMLLNAYSACSLVNDPNCYIKYEIDTRLAKSANGEFPDALYDEIIYNLDSEYTANDVVMRVLEEDNELDVIG